MTPHLSIKDQVFDSVFGCLSDPTENKVCDVVWSATYYPIYAFINNRIFTIVHSTVDMTAQSNISTACAKVTKLLHDAKPRLSNRL